MEGPCASLPGKPLPKAHWTGTCSLSPSTPGPQGSDTQPPGVGPQPPAPGEGEASQDGERGRWSLFGGKMGRSRRRATLPRCRCVSLRRSGWCFPTKRIISSYNLCFLNMLMARSGSSTVTYSLGTGETPVAS